MNILARVRGTWRVAVVEESMALAIRSGDWLLVDPTAGRWPRPGSVVVFREPDTDLLAIKRIAARGQADGGPAGHVRIEAGILHLEPDEAWLLGDAADVSVDSRRYGPVPFDRYVGRVWFRYGPLGRVGPVGRRRSTGGAAADR
jgi:hypothetical protein